MDLNYSKNKCILKQNIGVPLLFCLISWLISIPLYSQSTGIKAAPTANQLSENGKVTGDQTIEPGDQLTGAAPMEVDFISNVSDASSTLRYEWKFSQSEDFTTTLFSRFEENTTYTFNTSGKFYVKLYITDTATSQTYESDIFYIQISESELKVPNAFSPNGDGVNDLFKVKYKSLVKFNATVFNRWGQELYKWSNPDEGWDGTSHGKAVKDGVYFIVIRAEGADGIKYNHKGDINILRGYNGSTSSGSTGE